MKEDEICIIIGASHAGVNCAFTLRREGWLGSIIIYDKDPQTPYHRPPLSKSFLTSDSDVDDHLLMSLESYKKENIDLRCGITVTNINRNDRSVILSDGSVQSYDKLVLATGAKALVPDIIGIKNSSRIFYLRSARDANQIRKSCHSSDSKRVVIIGGGYIGLESAASLRQLGAEVTVLERDHRLLSRVTAPEMSDYFLQLHTAKGVVIGLNKNVSSIESQADFDSVICADGTQYHADLIILGVGVTVNTSLAKESGLQIDNGIKVDNRTQTLDEHIYAIGDCTNHFNFHYKKNIRLESVQNAVDQAKVAAKNICRKEAQHDTVPWFWSDQYDVKLQMVGLSSGYNEVLLRNKENDNTSFSIWYFKDEELLAVDAVNSPKAYVLGSKFIKGHKRINKSILKNTEIPLKPSLLIVIESKRT